MAVDKLVDSAQLDADLTSVANAIRTKGGTSAQMAFPAGFVSAVNAIPTGSGKTLLADYTASEDVSQIDISGNFNGFVMYLLELNGELSENEWIYPSVNGESQTALYWGGSGGSITYALKVFIASQPDGTPNGFPNQKRMSIPITVGSGSYGNYVVNVFNGFNSIVFNLYRNTNLFKSGFNVKLWGVTV